MQTVKTFFQNADLDAGRTRVEEMLARGYTLGSGVSASLGFYQVTGFDRDKKKADAAKLVISCGNDEKEYVFRQTLLHTQCVAEANIDDHLLTVVEIVERPTA